MIEPITYVTQSKYFSPAFNAAIFDGPIRIYFAQYQEAQALKVYFTLQERFQDLRKNARNLFRERGGSIFIMLYPTEETFDMCFQENAFLDETFATPEVESCDSRVRLERLGNDFVVGARGVLEDSIMPELYQRIEKIVSYSLSISESAHRQIDL